MLWCGPVRRMPASILHPPLNLIYVQQLSKRNHPYTSSSWNGPPPHSSPSEDIIRGHPLWYIHIRKGDGPPEVEIVQTCWGSLHEVADKGAGNPNIPKSCKHHMCTPYPTRCSRVGYYSVFLFFLDVASPLAMTALVVSSVSSSLSERVMSLDSLLVSRSVWKVMGHHHCKAGIKTEGKTKQ